MLKRILSASILIPIIAAGVFIAPKLIFSLLVTVLCCIGFYEFLSFPHKKNGNNANVIIFLISVPVGFFMIYSILPLSKGELVAVYFAIITIVGFFSIKEKSQAFEKIIWPFFGFIYIFYLFSFTYNIRFGLGLKNGSLILFLFLVIQWIGDTFAYFTGRFMGRNKLSPEISPNKTIEGSIGGLVGSGIVGLALGFAVNSKSIVLFILLGVFMGIMGQFGDLLESLLKRYFNIKDSSNLIPGHGGMLDRLDSLLITAPLFYFCMKLLITL